MPVPLKIISGGQTGADRAALDWAVAQRLPHGGWCPRDRWAEDGPIAARYQLRETPSADPAQRTEWNVRDADGTVVFSLGPELAGGSQLTADLARRHRKPLLRLTAEIDVEQRAARLRSFVEQHAIRTLNVAGPRASEAPLIARVVWETLDRAFNPDAPPSR